jgi:hypothetical protein
VITDKDKLKKANEEVLAQFKSGAKQREDK